MDATGTCAVFYKLSAVDIHGNESLFATVNSPCEPTSVLATLVSAGYERGMVRLRWSSSSERRLSGTIYRRTQATEWGAVGTVTADASGDLAYEDAAVTAGERCGYQLGILDREAELLLGETWVQVPTLQLTLHTVTPNPTTRATLRVAFTLPQDGPAIPDLFDVRGRLVHQQEVGNLGSGYHEVRLSPERPLGAGIYLIRLSQAGNTVVDKAVVVN